MSGPQVELRSIEEQEASIDGMTAVKAKRIVRAFGHEVNPDFDTCTVSVDGRPMTVGEFLAYAAGLAEAMPAERLRLVHVNRS